MSTKVPLKLSFLCDGFAVQLFHSVDSLADVTQITSHRSDLSEIVRQKMIGADLPDLSAEPDSPASGMRI